MNKEAMQKQILEALSKKLGDGYSIHIQEVYKTNVKLDGLTIRRCGSNISPTIYLDPFYAKLKKGEALDNIINEISRLYFNASSDMVGFDVSPIYDFNYVKERVFVQLINKCYNEELLRDIPYMTFLDDFAVIVRCLVESTEVWTSSFLVRDNHLKMWEIGSDNLLSIAVQNTRKMFGVDLMRMTNVIMELDPDFDSSDGAKVPLWVLTNKKRFLGASTILFDDILRDFANIYGNFYVIFSSIHEVLLLPTSDSSDIDSITSINQTVNAFHVQEDEVLGTKAYFYSKKDGFACKG